MDEESVPELPPLAEENKRGPGCIVLPAVLLIVFGVYLGVSQIDFTAHHEHEFERWVSMCAKEHGDDMCRDFGGRLHEYCYQASGGDPIGPHIIRERTIETLYRGEYSKNHYYKCLDSAVGYALWQRSQQQKR